MNEKGISFIEVLISMFVLIIVSFPIVHGFSRTQQTIKSAENNYISNINANNLLLDVENLITDNKQFENDFIEQAKEENHQNILEVFNSINFEVDYNTAKYNYAVVIQKIDKSPIRKTVIYSTTSIPTEALSVIQTDNAYLFEENHNDNMYDSVSTITDSINIIDVSKINKSSVFVKVELDEVYEDKYILLRGTQKNITLQIELPNYEYKNLIHINYDKSNNVVCEYFVHQNLLTNYLTTVIVYGENNNLMNSISKLICI
jgi:Tfp pilus assembly protein PilV